MSSYSAETIEQYLAGELTGDALTQFEDQLRQDPELAEEVRLWETVHADMGHLKKNEAGSLALEKTLKQIGTEFTTTAKVKPFTRWWLYASAAAAVILFFILRSVWTSPEGNEKLYAYYAGKTEPLSVVMRGENTDSMLQVTAGYYNRKEYGVALPLLISFNKEYPADTSLYLAAGVCYMQQGSLDSAFNRFSRIASGQSAFKEEAIWNMALVYLKENKTADCIRTLQMITAGSARYNDAKELEKKIKK